MVDLREYEAKTVGALKKLSGKASVEQIVQETGLPDATVMRSAMTLQEKRLIQSSEKRQTLAKAGWQGIGAAYAPTRGCRVSLACDSPRDRAADALYSDSSSRPASETDRQRDQTFHARIAIC